MQKLIARKFGFPLQDFIKRTKIIDSINFLNNSQFWSDNEIQNYQLFKLKKLLKFAKYNVPYYDKLFNKINLNIEDIKVLDDIQKIPVLTKDIIRKEKNNMIARDFNWRFVSTGKTGGTTGSPLLVHKDNNDRTFTWASYL